MSLNCPLCSPWHTSANSDEWLSKIMVRELCESACLESVRPEVQTSAPRKAERSNILYRKELGDDPEAKAHAVHP